MKSDLTIGEALELSEELLDGVLSDAWLEDNRLVILTESEDLPEAALRLRDDETMSCRYLCFVAGVDKLQYMEAIYLLRSLDHPWLVEIRVRLDHRLPEVPTVTNIWPGANWHEREAYDLFGINFKGHPDLRRILNREDLDVFPLRKDARPHRKTRLEWRWEGLEPPRRLPEEPPRRERS